MTDNTEVKEPTMYAVYRNGVRVSDSEYDSSFSAQTEYKYWENILKRWPDGSKLEVREINRYRRRN